MNSDTEVLARFWRAVGAMLAAALNMLGEDDNLLTIRLRTQLRRLCRMAEYVIRRILVMTALERIQAGETADFAPLPCKQEVSTKRPKPQSSPPADQDMIAPFRMRLIEPFFTPGSPQSTQPSQPDTSPEKLGRDTLLEPAEALKLRLRIEALQAIFAQREHRIARLMAWFTQRRETDEGCIPWRYGARLGEHHRDFGGVMKEAWHSATTALDRYISWLHFPPDGETADTSDIAFISRFYPGEEA